MSGTVVGIDVGSRGLRVAWSTGSEQPAAVTDLPPAGREPWIVPVVSARAVGFVSMRELRSAAMVETLTGELARAREAVGAESGAEVGCAVLSVPARLGTGDRMALREAARSAGFAEVHLINDVVAAVLADRSGEASTVLVYSLGYSGFETGLLRVARRQVRVLSHAGAVEPSGAKMDLWLLNAWLDSLSDQDLSDLGTWDVTRWGRLREAAEEVKPRLAAGEQVTVAWPPWVTETAGQPNRVQTPSPEEFARYVGEHVAATAKHVREVIADAEMTPADVDAVLLVGGVSALPAIRAMLEAEVGNVGSAAEPYQLARGAAVYGSYLRPSVGTMSKDAELADLQDTPSPPVLAVRIPERPVNAPPDVFAEARRLWAGGAADEARTLLTDLVDRANRMLAEMSSAPPEEPAQPGTTPEERERARRAIRAATRLLHKGRLQRAVDESHRALNQAREDDEIFAQMIDIHMSAARALPGPEGYANARAWLGCARVHAKFNEAVAAYFVERTLEYARHLLEHDQVEDAGRLLEECVFYETSDPGVRQLAEELEARRRI